MRIDVKKIALLPSEGDNADIKRILGVYFEQDVTTDRYEDFDGERWIVLGVR